MPRAGEIWSIIGRVPIGIPLSHHEPKPNETVEGSNKAKDLHPATVTSPTAALRLKDLPPPQQ
jgi:hypothetical protein